MDNNNEIILDAKNWKSKSDFYDAFSDATIAPKWFGRNLDAFNDWFNGGICKITPEKIIIHNFTSKVKEYIGIQFWKDIEEICSTQDVELEIHND